MKSKKLLLALTIALLVPWAANAQTTVFSDGFEDMTSAEYLTSNGYFTYSDASCNFTFTTGYHGFGNDNTKALYADSWNGSNGCIQILGLPVLANQINGLQIAFTYYSSSSSITLGYLTADDKSTFVPLQNYSSNSSMTSVGPYDLSAVPTTATRIAIRFNSYWRFYVDDINVSMLPTCPKPTLSGTVATTETTATVNWTPANTDQQLFDLYWSTTNTAPTDETTPSLANQSGTSYEFAYADLNPSSTYYVWVRGNCGTVTDPDVSGGWVGPVSFDTPCETISTLPWTENFEGKTANTVPQCWDNSASTTSDVTNNPHYVWGVYSYNNNQMLRMHNYFVHTGTALINTPLIAVPANGEYLLYFDYAHNANCGAFMVKISEDGGTTFVEKGSYTKGSGSSYSDPGTFTAATPIDLSSYAGKTIIVQFFANANYGSGAIFVDNVRIDLPTPTITEVVSTSPLSTTVNWTGTSTATGYVYQYKLQEATEWGEEYSVNSSVLSANLTTVADGQYDFRLKAQYGTNYSSWVTTQFTAPGYCMVPTNLVISNVTSNSAQLTWTEEFGEGEWTLQYKTAAEEEYTTYGTVTTSDMPVTLGSLSDNTTYNVKIYPNCDETKFITNQFTTKQIPVAVGNGWSDDFEGTNNWAMVNGGNNAWVVGSAVNNGGTKALYVSNDNGTTNAYNASGINMVYATKLLTFETGTYLFEYDWKAKGESSYDYIRAWLAPASFEFTANQLPDGTTDPYYYINKTPEGWISLDGGSKLNEVSEWQNEVASVDVAAGTYKVVFMWCNDGSVGYQPPAAIDNFSIERETCIVVSNVNKSNVTNHSATIAWTAPEGQTAWQIAYSTASFDPNAAGFDPTDPEAGATIVDANTNPYLFDKTLAANTTYYLYVRGDCTATEEGYSRWTALTGNTFTTTMANPAPTITNVDEITPISAKVHWTATGDYVESFDIFYRHGTSGAPTEEETPQYTNVTGNEYTISIDEDGFWYVYMRAHHGNSDGTSAWSSVKQFNAPELCPKPTSLTVTEPTPTSLKLSWTNGAEWQEGWTIAYSTTQGFDPNDTEACTYVEAPTNPFVVENLGSETTYYFRVKGACDEYEANSEWNQYEATGTTLVNCPAPEITSINDVMPYSATVAWTGYSETYNLRYGTPTTPDPTAPVTIILEAHNVWEDGTGYQMLFDADATAYGTLWNENHYILLNGNQYSQGDLPEEYYDEFEYKIPEGADGAMSTTNIVVDGSVTITIPAGTYDYVILNPDPDNRFYVASDSGEVGGIEDDFVFEPGMTYHFTMQMFGDSDGVAFSITSNAIDWQPIVEGITSPYTIPNLEDEKEYYVEVQAVCGDIIGEWSETKTFTTPSVCTPPTGLSTSNVTYNAATLNWASDYYLENFDVQYRTAGFDGYYLNETFDGELGDWSIYNLQNGSGVFNGNGIDGSKCFGFYYTNNPPQYLFSPKFEREVGGSHLTFYYAANSSYYPETFKVGYTNLDNPTLNDFTWGDEITVSSTVWTDTPNFDEEIPAGTKYFAIQCTSYDAYILFLDNFVIYNADAIQEPGEWNTDNTNINANTLTISGLDANTEYEWQVKGYSEYCTDGTAWSASAYFTTGPLPTQTIALSEGYNWFSTNLDITLDDLKAAFVAAFPGASSIRITAQNSRTLTYNGSTWRAQAGFVWDVMKMFKVQTPSSGELVLEGMPIASATIDIVPGHNWIGYPLSESMTVTNAFANFNAVPNDRVTSSISTFSTYNGSRWRGTLSNLEPGKGYILYSASTDTRQLTFPTGTRQTSQLQVKKLTSTIQPMPQVSKKADFRTMQKAQKNVRKIQSEKLSK